MGLPAASVVWIWGPPGVGKTTVAWEFWKELGASSTHAAYVDIDQLGISLPSPGDDPQRYGLKVRNLAAVVANFHAQGARVVVVSGTCDTQRVREFAQSKPVTVCRLRLDHDELRTRLDDRGWSESLIDDAMAEAVELDACAIAQVSVDTTGLSVAAVVRSVRERVCDWSASMAEVAEPARDDEPARNDGPGEIVWLCGATGVGKSTVGFELFTRAWREGQPAAFVDLAQIGFVQPAPADDPGNHRVKARNLASMWAEGVPRMVVVGAIDDRDHIRRYAERLPCVTWSLVRLDASREHLVERIGRRGNGEGPRIPGERLCGLDAAQLARIVDEAEAEAARLASARIGDVVVQTDGRPAAEVVAEICRRLGW